MGSISNKIQESALILSGLGVLGFLGIVWLMIYGNLSGNLGFANNSLGANNTNTVINSQTNGFVTFFSFSNTFFTIAAVILLIFMFVGLLGVVMGIVKSFRSKGSGNGFSGY